MLLNPPATNILDHIVHLSPPDSLQETISEFQRLGFTVLPGGSHVDGITSNALVILPDGVYLELIFFNKPNPPPAHRWGTRSLGWIDAANLGTDPNLEDVINERYGYGLYLPGQEGGRMTPPPESKELKWKVTFSNPEKRAGELPFFCGDQTPREWRVPTIPVSNTVHDNQVLGVKYITYITPAANLAKFTEQFTAVFGTSPSEAGAWNLTTPSGKLSTELILRAAKQDDEFEMERGSGVYEVGFWVVKGAKEGLVDSKWGRIVLVSVDI